MMFFELGNRVWCGTFSV